jgi:hypothetical protein
VWTSARIIADAGSSVQNSNKITFDQFANWYTTGGFTASPFLELLDLRKVS